MSLYVLLPNTCVTPDVISPSTIEFRGENEGDWGSILVDNRIIRVQISEDGTLIWDENGRDEIEFVSSGEYLRHPAETRYITVTYEGTHSGYHSFTVEVEIPECYRYDNLDSHLTTELLQSLNNEISSPSGVWQEYNEWNNRWQMYRYFSSKQSKVICPSDLPEEPKIEDY